MKLAVTKLYKLSFTQHSGKLTTDIRVFPLLEDLQCPFDIKHPHISHIGTINCVAYHTVDCHLIAKGFVDIEVQAVLDSCI